MIHKHETYTITELLSLLDAEAQTLEDLPAYIKRTSLLEQQAALLATLLVTRNWHINYGFLIRSEVEAFVLLNDSPSSNRAESDQEYAVTEVLDEEEAKKLYLRQWESIDIGPFEGQTEIEAIKLLYQFILSLFEGEEAANPEYYNQGSFPIRIAD
jgi:hypothetical protein